MPARLIGTVKKSLRYIESGSSVFSPSPKATEGEVGVTTKSISAKAAVKSSAILRADLLGLAVVGVVVAGGERVGAEHDPPLDLGAEALRARRLVHLQQVAGAARRASRSGRRRSGPGWRRPRPGRSRSRRRCRARRWAARPRRSRRRGPRSRSASPRRPRARRRRSRRRRARSGRRSAGRSRSSRLGATIPPSIPTEVESQGSRPCSAASSSAASVTSRVSGPHWSSEEAKAIIP